MRKLKQNGFSFIEVLASVLLLAGTIIPMITFAADGLAASFEIERKAKSTLLAEAELEKIKNHLRNSFDTDFTAWSNNLADNYLAGRTCTDVSATLKIITVSVGYDANKNGSLGQDEIAITLRTQYALRN